MAAEQLRGEQKRSLTQRCRCPVVAFDHALTLLEQFPLHYGRDRTLHPYVLKLIHADVLLVLEDPAQTVFIKQAAPARAVALSVQARVYLLRRVPGGVFLEDPANHRGCGRIQLEAAVRSLPESEDSLAQRFELQSAVIIPALHVLAQVFAIIFRVSLHDRLQNNALRALRD